MNPKYPKYIGIILGVLYGLSLRLLWEIEALRDIGGLVRVSFMFFVPFVIGFIRIHFECKVTADLPVRKMIAISWRPVLFFLLATVVTLLGGSICIAIALPAFMFFQLGWCRSRVCQSIYCQQKKYYVNVRGIVSNHDRSYRNQLF
jgi:hypothetical protein